jgi:hypothetical protein
VLRRVICSDTTIEKLAEILEDNPKGTLVARDELAGWLGSFTRYKGKAGGTDLPNWLEMHRAGTVIVDRKTGERRTLFIQRAAVCVTGGIQPGALARNLTPEFLDSGGAARLLMAMPPKLRKQWSDCEIAPEVEQAYETVLDRLMGLDFASDAEGKPVPHRLRMTPEAKALWVRFYNEWASEQAAAAGALAAAFSKLEAYAARFALLHHVVSRVGPREDDCDAVEPASIEAGVTLCRWCAGEARRSYATLTESAEERDARRLVEFLQSRGGRATVKELQRSNAHKYPTATEAEQALEALVSYGWARWQDRPPTARGGRPTRDCILTQTTDETDETPGDGPGGEEPGPDETSDDTPQAADDTPRNPEDFGVSSVSSMVGCNTSTPRGWGGGP